MQPTIRVSRPQLELPPAVSACLPPHLLAALPCCAAPAVEEIRLRAARETTVTASGKSYRTGVVLDGTALSDILKRMCGGSLYAYNATICQGFLTLAGGVRVGICGSAATDGERVIGVSDITGLILRIPHRVSADVSPLAELLRAPTRGGILIYAPPAVGKTTALRLLAETLASPAYAKRTVVVDSREELCTLSDDPRLTLDILRGYPRALGIEIAVRSLAAEVVLCDEIGNEADAKTVLSAANCGVPIVATVHAARREEVLCRRFLRELLDARAFCALVGLKRTSDGRFLYDIFLL